MKNYYETYANLPWQEYTCVHRPRLPFWKLWLLRPNELLPEPFLGWKLLAWPVAPCNPSGFLSLNHPLATSLFWTAARWVKPASGHRKSATQGRECLIKPHTILTMSFALQLRCWSCSGLAQRTTALRVQLALQQVDLRRRFIPAVVLRTRMTMSLSWQVLAEVIWGSNSSIVCTLAAIICHLKAIHMCCQIEIVRDCVGTESLLLGHDGVARVSKKVWVFPDTSTDSARSHAGSSFWISFTRAASASVSTRFVSIRSLVHWQWHDV